MPIQLDSYSNNRLVPAQYGSIASAILLAPNLSLSAGAVLGELTASPGVYAPYNAANGDGSEVAKCILERDALTDSDGNLAAGEFGQRTTAAAYFGGIFYTADLIGWDDNAAAVMKAKRYGNGSGADTILIPGG